MIPRGSFTTRPEIRGTFGVAASTHWLASQTAMGVLERGGNAFDAAAAGGFVLQVVEPHLNGPAGDLPLLTYDTRRGRIEAICGQGPAPAAATIGRFRDLGLDLIPGTGLLPAAVPGAFDAWCVLLRDYGTWTIGAVLEPAIAYAEAGHPLVPGVVQTIEGVAGLFRDHWPSSAAVYLPGGNVPAPGRLFRNPALARTWRRVVQAGQGKDREDGIEAARDAWYRGFVAEAVGRFAAETAVADGSGRADRGLITADDMAGWRATVEPPVTVGFRGLTVAKCGPWSQGPSFLIALKLLEQVDLDAMDPLGDAFVHHVVEAIKLGFADREAWLGDPDFVDVPLDALLSDAYARARMGLLTDVASRELRPGSPDDRAPRLAEAIGRNAAPTGIAAGAGEPTIQVGATGSAGSEGDTCHLAVIDRAGNMVAATPSGGWLQSSPVIPDLGFGLGTRLQMCWLEEGLPASLVPGKRPRTTLTPTMVLGPDGEPAMAFGTPGGDQQEQWQLSFFLRHVVHGMNLQAAIDAPNWHTDHAPSSFWPRLARPGSLTVEGRMAAATVKGLKERGHEVTVGPDWSEGRLAATAIETTPEGTVLKAAANPRGMQGYAVGR